MSFKAQAITITPAFVVFLIAIYLAILSFIIGDPMQKQQAVLLAVTLFYGGIAMAIVWVFYWTSQKVAKWFNRLAGVYKRLKL
jgi:hypothetical protein